jgi:hypothetical protein
MEVKRQQHAEHELVVIIIIKPLPSGRGKFLPRVATHVKTHTRAVTVGSKVSVGNHQVGPESSLTDTGPTQSLNATVEHLV